MASDRNWDVTQTHSNFWTPLQIRTMKTPKHSPDATVCSPEKSCEIYETTYA